MNKRFKFGFTLIEVVVVMLIIAVIVGISIKIAKTKLDNITSYTYYAAYSNLRSLSSAMVSDFNVDDDNYGVVRQVNNGLLAKLNFVFKPKGILPTFANISEIQRCVMPEVWDGTRCVNPNLLPNPIVNKQMCMTENVGELFDGASPHYVPTQCGYYCTSEGYMEELSPGLSPCPSGTHRSGVKDSPSCACVPDYEEPEEPEEPDNPYINPFPIDPIFPNPINPVIPNPVQLCPDEVPCGSWCNALTGHTVQPKPNFTRTCEDNQHHWSEASCGCIPTPQTLPRTGEGFCDVLVGYANTVASALPNGQECNGSRVLNPNNGFSNLTPDLVLRNGMMVYNVRQNYTSPDVLAGNSNNITFKDEAGNDVDVDENAYLVYVDIDGQRAGNGILWEDVYPFYITLSGTVIPLYDENNPETVGGDSIRHLKTSVADMFAGNSTWLTVSKSFKESACTIGTVKDTTPYCSGYHYNPRCGQEGHECSLKILMPVKFFTK